MALVTLKTQIKIILLVWYVSYPTNDSKVLLYTATIFGDFNILQLSVHRITYIIKCMV